MEIKLIASDMDDTLLNSKCQISARNEAAIRSALAAGKVFSFSNWPHVCLRASLRGAFRLGCAARDL